MSISHRNMEYAFYFWLLAFGGGTFQWIGFGVIASLLPVAWLIYLLRPLRIKKQPEKSEERAAVRVPAESVEEHSPR